jgi:Asp-tRNA(Asn)/Glu-tRNA(Gln) amidotransferase A subunit family amidase
MGSIIRPASFCGVVGFKPSYGALSTESVLPFAPSVDTVGFLADSAATCASVWKALGFSVESEQKLRFAVVSGLPDVAPEMQESFARATAAIRAGFGLTDLRLPAPYDRLVSAARLVNDYEGARSHHERWLQFGSAIGQKLSELVRRGMQIDESSYREQLTLLKETAAALDAIDVVLVTPAAPGAAPAGLASTGDPMVNAVWTALGMPAVSIPVPQDGGLPCGLQMIARRGDEALLLRAAREVESLLAHTFSGTTYGAR